MSLSIRARMILVITMVAVLFVGNVMAQAQGATSPSDAQTFKINDIKCEKNAESILIRIKCDTSPTYTMYELFNPLRLVIDIADAAMAESLVMPQVINQDPVDKITSQLLDSQQPTVTRLEIYLTNDRAYTVERVDNDIIVQFSAASPDKIENRAELEKIEVEDNETQTKVYITATGPLTDYQEAKLTNNDERPARLYIDLANINKGKVPQQINVGSALDKIRVARRDSGSRIVFDSGLEDRLFTYKIEPQDKGLLVTIDKPASMQGASASKAAENNTLSDNFTFTGYNEQRITVDFFKIDLHNVFRLLGEISGRNMVIEETVGGTLTLSLNEVPWDFVLDVILNLKDLQKEERFNTIVISPKSKAFTWPERASDKLSIRADASVADTGSDALLIKKRIDTPKGVVEAKTIIQQGDIKYMAKDYAGAYADYDNALSKWPDNARLAKRLATLCLVHLGQNAKAVHYAKLALKVDPKDYDAALQVAIGLANMKQNNAAKEYFDLAVSGPRPTTEALTNYASFNEENKNYVETLLLLTKNAELYGDNMETMLSKARIYDKQGDQAKAAKEYQSLLLSGYDIPADLKRYIKGRLSVIEH